MMAHGYGAAQLQSQDWYQQIGEHLIHGNHCQEQPMY